MKSENYRFTGCLFLAAALLFSDPPAASGSADMNNVNGTIAPSSGGGNSSFSFQADLFTGRFTYAVPIKVAPGRQGAQPALALGYTSAGGNGWCGVGWSLEVGLIQRDTRRGVPIAWSAGSATPLTNYDDAKGFVANVGGISGELVLVGATNENPILYRQAVETSFLTYKWYDDNHWEVVDKSGNTFFFGEGATNRMESTRSGWPSGAKGSTFRWFLN